MPDTFVTLNAWLNYFEHRHQEPIQLGLDRFNRVLSCFRLTFHKTLVITVGGTNGKGSTVSALDAIYTAAGYRVGRYTSPHLFRFNERICIAQQEVSDTLLCDIFAMIHQHTESLSLTYFEITTLAALLIFHQANVEVMLLEVGMGGRLDATNAIDADLSIITTVDFDHEAWLGQTREAIGFEKAGILRAGRPAIYADDSPPTSVMINARDLGVDMHYLQFYLTDDALVIDFKHHVFHLPKPRIQAKAATAAVVASLLLQSKRPVQTQHLIMAMEKVEIAGRQQWIQGNITQLYDVAHNPQAVALLAQSVARYRSRGVVRAVFSALKDKDLPGLIQPMAGFIHAWYPALLSGPRGASKEALRTAFESVQIYNKKWYNAPLQAFDAAWSDAEEDDLIVVFGSFLTVGAVLSSQLYPVEEKCGNEKTCLG